MANATYQQWMEEKLWELIPSIYRHEDGIASDPDVLRGLVEVMAKQAAILRRSHDRLWEDQFIETAEDWAVPYLGDLVATRLVSALSARGRRVDVAKTIYFRRRSGTLRVLEELIADIAGWEGRIVEQFRRLTRTSHGLDPAPGHLGHDATPRGGIANLRDPGVAELTGGPFDAYHHLPDARPARPAVSGAPGRFGISKLGVHLFRLAVYEVEDATPAEVTDVGTGDTVHTFDPSGRSIPLFARRSRPASWDAWHSAREWELPLAIRCRLLGQASYLLDERALFELRSEGLSVAAARDLEPFLHTRFHSEAALQKTLSSLPDASALLGADAASVALYRSLLDKSVTADSAKPNLVPDSLHISSALGPVLHPRVASGRVRPGSGVAPVAKDVVIDAEDGRWVARGSVEPTGVTYHYGFSGPVGAGTYSRRDLEVAAHSYAGGGSGLLAAVEDNHRVVAITDNATYTGVHDKTAVTRMVVQAADQRRPYLRLEDNWVLGASPAGTTTPDGTAIDSLLTLDGLWVGSRAPHDLLLDGNYDRVTLRHCTVDPGGIDAGGNPLHALAMVVRGHVEELRIERSILGRIRVDGGTIEKLFVEDCIIAAPAELDDALDLLRCEVHLDRVTVLGGVRCHRLWSDGALVTGAVQVTDIQAGCVRFSAIARGGRVPHPYETFRFDDSAGFFASRVFGDPGYGQLSVRCPQPIRTGAENGSEIGAFGALHNPIKRAGLLAKVTEYLPFGLIPLLLEES